MEKAVVEGPLMVCADGYIRQYHSIIAVICVDYEEQMVITSIKSKMQYSICQVSPKERENLYKTWTSRTQKTMWVKIAIQDTKEVIKDHSHRDPEFIYSI